MEKDPTSLLENRSEWSTFLSGERLPKVWDPDTEGVGEDGHGHLLLPPHVSGAAVATGCGYEDVCAPTYFVVCLTRFVWTEDA